MLPRNLPSERQDTDGERSESEQRRAVEEKRSPAFAFNSGEHQTVTIVG